MYSKTYLTNSYKDNIPFIIQQPLQVTSIEHRLEGYQYDTVFKDSDGKNSSGNSTRTKSLNNNYEKNYLNNFEIET